MASIKYKILIALGILCCIGSCKNPAGTAKIRIAQLLVSDVPMAVKLFKNGSSVYEHKLTFGAISKYQEVSSGTYTLQVIKDGNMLLEKQLGLGSKGKYSLCIYGLPVQDEQKNKATLNTRLHTIAEGDEASEPNGLLPQLKILNDLFYGDESKAKVRWLHATPGVQELKGYAISESSKDSISLKKLRYAKKSAFTEIKPGRKSLFWTMDIKNRKVAQKDINIQPKTLYTAFIIPGREEYIDTLQVLIANNKGQ